MPRQPKKLSLEEQNAALREEIKQLKEENESFEIVKAIQKVHEALSTRHLPLDELVLNPGLQHIAQCIFKKLDYNSLKNCRRVSKGWKTCIDNDKYWWHCQLVKCKTVRLPSFDALKYLYPDFTDQFEYICGNENLNTLKSFGTFMMDFFNESMNGWYGKMESPLHFAVTKNRLDIFELMTRTPMTNLNLPNLHDPDEEESIHGTMLGQACAENRWEIIEFLMRIENRQKVDFTEQASNGITLFHEACRSDSVEVVKLFLKHANELAIDLNLSEYSGGLTPFLYSFGKKSFELLWEDERIDVNATTVCHSGSSLFHAYYNFVGDELMVILQKLLNDPRIEDSSFHNHSTYPENLLHAACYRDRRDDHKIVELLLEHALKKGIDVDTIDRYGRTPTHFAFGYEYDYLEVYNNDHNLSHDHNTESGRVYGYVTHFRYVITNYSTLLLQFPGESTNRLKLLSL